MICLKPHHRIRLGLSKKGVKKGKKPNNQKLGPQSKDHDWPPETHRRSVYGVRSGQRLIARNRKSHRKREMSRRQKPLIGV